MLSYIFHKLHQYVVSVCLERPVLFYNCAYFRAFWRLLLQLYLVIAPVQHNMIENNK